MGSLSYVVGGGLAGGGAGVARVGAESSQAIVQQGLMRLQKQYAEEMQQRGFGQQKELQASGQTFEKGLKEEELKAHGAIAGAEMAQKERLAGQHETESTKRVGMLGASRENVQRIRNEGLADKNAAAAEKAKQWKVHDIHITTVENGAPVVKTIPGLVDPVSNQVYVQVGGGKLVRWNSATNAPDVDEKALSRIQPPQAALNAVYSDPEGVIPSAFRGGGMTNKQFFEQTYHYLPPGIQRGGTGAGAGAGGAAEPEESEGSQAAEDQEDMHAAGADPFAQQAGTTNYGFYGPGGPQASDTEPAQ